MNDHVTHDEMASYLADTLLPGERDRFDSHIRECETCRDKLDKIKIALTPRFRSVELRDETVARILRSWDAIQVEAARGGMIAFLRKHPRAAVASALAAAAATIIVVSALMNAPREPAGAHLTLGRVEGGVAVNEEQVHAGGNVFGGSRITLPDKALARLVYGEIMKIDLISRCDLSVDAFGFDRADTIRLENSLRDGIIISSIHDSGKNVSYVYTTPNARIESQGTEFLLQAEGGKTLLIMKTDAVRAIHARSGKSEIVPAGMKCVISDSLEIMAATDEDMRIFENIEGLRKGDFGRLLLPAFHDRKSGTQGKSPAPGDPGVKNGGSMMDKGNGAAEKVREGDTDGRDARRERDREMRQQRMEQKKLHMNEMRRSRGTSANQQMQMRRGR
ncbi:MAG: zf-HC2 domain-containing protein [Spirochaetes bacterium]|nr:zf-HC2 domain-containing protein [Spirochaetota bacterium]